MARPNGIGLFKYLNHFFEWCLKEDLISTSPTASLTRPKDYESRDRILSYEEIKVLWKCSGELGYPYQQFYRVLLLDRSP